MGYYNMKNMKTNSMVILSVFFLLFIFSPVISFDISASEITTGDRAAGRNNMLRGIDLDIVNSDFGSVEVSFSFASPGDEVLIWVIANPGFIITGSEATGVYDWEILQQSPTFQIHRFIMADNDAVFCTGFGAELAVDVESNRSLGGAWAISGASEMHSNISSAKGMTVELFATAHGFERWEVISGNAAISSHFRDGDYVHASFIMPDENVRIRAVHVSTLPVITVYNAPNGMMGEAYGANGNGFRFLTDNSTIWTWSLTGTLPQGLNFDSESGTISGTPTQFGTFEGLTIRAANALGYDEKVFSITIDRPKQANAVVNFGVSGAGGILKAHISEKPIESGSYHPINSNVLFTAVPSAGFRVASWTVNGITATGNVHSIIRSIATDGLNISVVFEQISAAQLPYPVNLNLSGSNLSWSAVPEASGYRLYINGVSQTAVIATTSFNLATLGLSAGTYSVQIRALSSNAGILNSLLSASLDFLVNSKYSDGNSENETDDYIPSSPPKSSAASAAAPGPSVNHQNETVLPQQAHSLIQSSATSGSFYTFIDISPDTWYFSYVGIVTSAGLFQGTGEGYFNPNSGMTRAMFAQVLANLGGDIFTDYTETSFDFTDVSNDAWYFSAVKWASSLGIVSGFGDGSFAPRNDITREQMAVMLFRFANIAEMEVSLNSEANFVDYNDISPWATEVVAAIQQMGLITGRPDGRFDPQATATRAEVATIFARFLLVFDYAV